MLQKVLLIYIGYMGDIVASDTLTDASIIECLDLLWDRLNDDQKLSFSCECLQAYHENLMNKIGEPNPILDYRMGQLVDFLNGGKVTLGYRG